MIAIDCFMIRNIIQWQMIEQVFHSVHDAPLVIILVSSVIPKSSSQINNYSEFWRQRVPRIDSILKNESSRMETVSSVRCHGLNGMNQKSFELQIEGHIDGKNDALEDIRQNSEHTIVNQKLRRKNDKENQSKFRIVRQFKAFLAHYLLFICCCCCVVMGSNFPQHVTKFAVFTFRLLFVVKSVIKIIYF